MKLKLCLCSGCNATALNGKDFCNRHIAMQQQRDEQKKKIFTKRTKSNQWHGLYNSARWRRESKEFLQGHPFCYICGKPSRITDHIQAHRGDLELFWNQLNWQPLCWSCHSRKTFKENNNFHANRMGVKEKK